MVAWLVNQLNGLVQNKIRRPVILNGKLLMKDKALVTLRREKYRVVMACFPNGRGEVIIDEPDEVFNEAADVFNRKYLGILEGRSFEDLTSFSSSVCPFTGAVILKNKLYDFYVDKDNIQHLHDGQLHFKPEIQKLITEFDKEFIVNYYEIFSILMNRKLTGSHMPMFIKGHLVSGLYQPLVIASKEIDCPLNLGEFSWFHEYLQIPNLDEVRLESMQETTRGLELTAIAMCDYAQKFNVKIATELNRIYFLFVLYAVLLDMLESGAASLMVNRFAKIYNAMQNDAKVVRFFTESIEGIRHARTALIPI